jgi:hypothetical protein
MSRRIPHRYMPQSQAEIMRLRKLVVQHGGSVDG